jgi:UDP-N-acetylglucosamine--dolichyl-phosphate N-acetylglucosaminephosphotransferase
MYKKGKPPIPNLGGLAILFGIIAGLIVAQLLIIDVKNLLIFYFVVIVYAIFTLTDDLVNVGRKSKIFIPFFLALPIALLSIDTTFSFFFFELDMGIFFTYVIAPVYLMVVANLINMHSGFNGLQTGLSGILLVTIVIKVIMKYGWETTHFIMPVLAAVLAFWYFDRYPSKIFLGNVGSYTIGPAIGGLLILNNMEFFGVVILAPHIINFLMSVYTELVRGYKKERNIFGKLRKDGTIEPPDYPTMKWLPARYAKLTEKQLTYIMYVKTVVFCVIGLVFF